MKRRSSINERFAAGKPFHCHSRFANGSGSRRFGTVLKSKSARWLVNGLLALVGIAISLLAAEGFLHATGAGITIEHRHEKFEIRLDPRILYRVKPHSREDINRYGYRDRDFSKKRAVDGPKRILFLGDSFVMGLNVSPEQTWPKALEQVLGSDFEVMNLGVAGYGPDQSLTQLEDEALEFDPDVVVLGIFAANDFADIKKNRIYSIDADGKLVRNPSNPVTEVVSSFLLVQRFQTLFGNGPLDEEQQREIYKTLFRDTYDIMKHPSNRFSQEKIALMRAVLHDFASILAERKIPFLVALAPLACTIDETPWCVNQALEHRGRFVNEDIVANLCDEIGIRYVHLGADLLEFALAGEKLYSGDQHFTPLGSQRAARLVANALQLHYPDSFPNHTAEKP
jgi:hypothetical protein